MQQNVYQHKKDLPPARSLAPGTAMCAGCGALQVVRLVHDVLGENCVFINAAGCLSLLSVYPLTPFRGSWLYAAMASAAAGGQGVRDALDILLAKKRITPEQNLQVVVLAGDGSASGMGLAATSSAIERGLDFIYICYDNEGYGNTGHQTAETTPGHARTATDTGATGFAGRKKDLFAIYTAQKPAYAATLSGAEPLDLAQKVEKARHIKGPRLFIAYAPCPTGWGYEPEESIAYARLAVKTGIWPLKEYQDGQVRHTRRPARFRPVEEYLRGQRRFAHLFAPEAGGKAIAEIQQGVDAYWAGQEGQV